MSRQGKKQRRYKYDTKKESNAIDAFLSDRGMERKPVAKDGSCLFRAVAEQAWLTQARHEELRLLCAYHIRQHSTYFQEFLTIPVDEYSFKLGSSKLWGGEIELCALSRLLNRKIVVYSYSEEEKGKVKEMTMTIEFDTKHQEPVRLAYYDKNHYDSVWSLKERKTTAVCQSLVYEILVERVMKEKLNYWTRGQLSTLTEEKLTALNAPREIVQLTNKYTDEMLLALAPLVYRNTPLDVERRERQSREQKDRHVAAEMQFQVGQHCQVRVGGRSYRGEIVQVDTRTGHSSGAKHAKVLIQENKESWSIPYKDIVLLPSNTSSHGGHTHNYRKRDADYNRSNARKGPARQQHQQQPRDQHSSTIETTHHFVKQSPHPTTTIGTSTTSTTTATNQPDTFRSGSLLVQSRVDTSQAKGLLGEYPKELDLPRPLLQQLQTTKQQQQQQQRQQPWQEQQHSPRLQSNGVSEMTFRAAVVGSGTASSRGPITSSISCPAVTKPTSSPVPASAHKSIKDTSVPDTDRPPYLKPGASFPASVTTHSIISAATTSLRDHHMSNKNGTSAWNNKSKPFSAVSTNNAANSDGGSTSTSSSDDYQTSPPQVNPSHSFPSVAHHSSGATPTTHQHAFNGTPVDERVSSHASSHQEQRQWLLPHHFPLGGSAVPPGVRQKEGSSRAQNLYTLEGALFPPSSQAQAAEANLDHPPPVGLPSTSQAASMMLPSGILLPPQAPPSSMGGTGQFPDPLYMNAFVGRPYPDLLTQKQLSSITDAPESEWPNLTAGDIKNGLAAYAQSGSFIDGPPAPSSAAAGAAGENIGSQVMGFQMSMMYPPQSNHMYLLMNELNPPIHLLQHKTNEARQQFMFEYAKNCLRVYSKYISDPELEDNIDDLLRMQLEDFAATYASESQLSVCTSYTSRAESEVTDERCGLTPVGTEPTHVDNSTSVDREDESGEVVTGEEREVNETGNGVGHSEDISLVRLNAEQENYLSSLQQPQATASLSSPTSTESQTVEDTVPSPVGVFSPDANTHSVNMSTPTDSTQNNVHLSSSSPLECPEQNRNDDQADEEPRDDKQPPHTQFPPAPPPPMYPPMMNPAPFMLPRYSPQPPYLYPYYYPPYGFPPTPWGYMPHPMMFPPVPIVPMHAPQLQDEARETIGVSSVNEEHTKIGEGPATDGSSVSSASLPISQTSDISDEHQLDNEKCGEGSTPQLSAASSVNVTASQSAPALASPLLSAPVLVEPIVQQSPSSPQLLPQQPMTRQPLLQNPSPQLSPQHSVQQLPNQHSNQAKGLLSSLPSSVKESDNTAKPSHRHSYKKPRSGGIAPKKEPSIAEAKQGISGNKVEEKPVVEVKDADRQERPRQNKPSTAVPATATTSLESDPAGVSVEPQELDKPEDKDAGLTSRQPQRTGQQSHGYYNQRQYYRRPYYNYHNYRGRGGGGVGGQRGNGYKPREETSSGYQKGNEYKPREETSSSYQDEGKGLSSYNNQDGRGGQGRRWHNNYGDRQQTGARYSRGPHNDPVSVREFRPQNGGFRKGQNKRMMHTQSGQQSASGKPQVTEDATVRGAETHLLAHSPVSLPYIPFTADVSPPSIGSRNSSFTELSSFVSCTQESGHLIMPSGLEPVLFGSHDPMLSKMSSRNV